MDWLLVICLIGLILLGSSRRPPTQLLVTIEQPEPVGCGPLPMLVLAILLILALIAK